MATWGFAFAGVSGAGTGGQSYVHRNLLLGDTTLVDLANTGTVPLRYLVISTMAETEICEYPDSGKFLAQSKDPATGEIVTTWELAR